MGKELCGSWDIAAYARLLPVFAHVVDIFSPVLFMYL
jgi:hypothetical protein